MDVLCPMLIKSTLSHLPSEKMAGNLGQYRCGRAQPQKAIRALRVSKRPLVQTEACYAP
jgi:hypothetical protein